MFSSPQPFKANQFSSPPRDGDIKVQILELQLREAMERELNIKKLNEQLMKAMNEVEHRPEYTKEIQILSDRHQVEINNLRQQHETIKTQLMADVAELKLRLTEQQNIAQNLSDNLKQCQILKDDLTIDVGHLNHQLALESQRYQELLVEREQTNIRHQQIVDKLKAEAVKDRQEWALEARSAIESLKQIHEYEKNMLKITISSLQQEKEAEVAEKQKIFEDMQELREKFENNQKYLLDSLSAFHQQHSSFMTQNYQQSLSMQIKDQELKQREIHMESERVRAEIRNQELSEQNKQLQAQIKSLQVQINEKDLKYSDTKNELTKKLAIERKRADTMQEAAQRIKEDYQKRQTLLLQESVQKEQRIKSLQSHINQLRVRCDSNAPDLDQKFSSTQQSGEKLFIKTTPQESKFIHRTKQQSEDFSKSRSHNKSNCKSHMSINLFLGPAANTENPVPSPEKDNMKLITSNDADSLKFHSEDDMANCQPHSKKSQGSIVGSLDQYKIEPKKQIERNPTQSLKEFTTKGLRLNVQKFNDTARLISHNNSSKNSSYTNRSLKSIREKENKLISS